MDVIELPADEKTPDCLLVDDTAVVINGMALICSPPTLKGRPSRQGEVGGLEGEGVVCDGLVGGDGGIGGDGVVDRNGVVGRDGVDGGVSDESRNGEVGGNGGWRVLVV